jgi:predicted nucleic-acid-binding Zn-ribbon protein
MIEVDQSSFKHFSCLKCGGRDFIFSNNYGVWTLKCKRCNFGYYQAEVEI